MRRSQSIRKAAFALVILVIFMTILRFSRPASLTTEPTVPVEKPPIAPHHDPLKDQIAKIASESTKAAQAPAPSAVNGNPDLKDTSGSPSLQEESTYDAAKAFQQIVFGEAASPVVIFSKSYCPHSMRAKKILLEAHTIVPPPKVIELDQISHGAELQKYIEKETGRGTVPNILVNGKTRGGASDMVELGDTLASLFSEWGQGKLTIKKEQAMPQ